MEGHQGIVPRFEPEVVEFLFGGGDELFGLGNRGPGLGWLGLCGEDSTKQQHDGKQMFHGTSRGCFGSDGIVNLRMAGSRKRAHRVSARITSILAASRYACGLCSGRSLSYWLLV